MKEKKDLKTTILLTLAFILTAIVGATFAYFRAQTGLGANAEIEATTGTTETLSFSVGQAIDINASLENFSQGQESLKGETTATAILTPATGTTHAKRKYNVFFIIDHNDFEYTQEEHTPELILKVTDPSNKPHTDILGLPKIEGQDTFDITNQTGSFLIAKGYDIEANEAIGTTQTWKVEVTLVNLNKEQNDNQGKTLSGSIYITTDDKDTYVLNKIKFNEPTIEADKITVNLGFVNPGTKEIAKYYYKIEPDTEAMAIALDKDGYTEWDDPTYTFDELDSNTAYKVSAYVKDINGYNSEVITETLKTSYVEPTIDVEKTEVTEHSISIQVIPHPGSTNIKEGCVRHNY